MPKAPAGMATSIVFNGSTDYIVAGSSADFGFGPGILRLKYMQYIPVLGTMAPVDCRVVGTSNSSIIYFLSDGTLHYFTSSDKIVSAAGVIVCGDMATCCHLANKLTGQVIRGWYTSW